MVSGSPGSKNRKREGIARPPNGKRESVREEKTYILKPPVLLPESSMKTQAHSADMAHLQQPQGLLFFWKLGIELNDAGFQHSKRHSNQRSVRLIHLAAGCLHLHMLGLPGDHVDFGPELNMRTQAVGEQFD